MIRLTRPALEDSETDSLAAWQADIDLLVDYPTRVTRAKDLFKSKNTKSNPVFTIIKTHLLAMSNGSNRCHYCEDSAPDEVEHFKPKDLYPESCFNWNNYLYSCGPCNGSHKNNNFKVIAANGQIVDITRARGAAVTSPSAGSPLLIDPASENPLDYMELDFLTAFYIPTHDIGSMEHDRAKYTIDLLGLNSRDILVASRKSALGSFIARLREYIYQKNSGATQAALDSLSSGLRSVPCITVWEEMKRQRNYLSPLHLEINDLFDQAPECLTW